MYMRDILDCDMASGFFDPGSYSKSEITANTKRDDLFLKWLTRSRIFTKGIRHVKLKLAFLNRTWFLKKYDTVIFSGDCLAAVKNARPDTKKIFYCHTPPRYIFDKREWYESQLEKHYGVIYKLVRPLYRMIRDRFEAAYRRDIQKMDIVVANSKEVQARIKQYFDIDADIIYPPVDLSRFSSHESGQPSRDYYLSFGRLAEFKRVDVIIDAFKDMSEKKLIVTYGKNDPIKDRLIRQAAGAKNIEFRTDVDDDEAIQLLQNAIATIYIPKDEDFGMVPIESMSCGTPVIWVDEGGLKESIVEGETGYRIDPNDLWNGLKGAATKLTPELSSRFSDACTKRAQEFGLNTFQEKVERLVG